jgi:hypothetical protein
MQCFCICICSILKLKYGADVGLDVLDIGILGTWLFWILVMKFLDHFWSIIKIGDRFPSPLTNVVSLPLNKILQFFLNDFGIKDL